MGGRAAVKALIIATIVVCAKPLCYLGTEKIITEIRVKYRDHIVGDYIGDSNVH